MIAEPSAKRRALTAAGPTWGAASEPIENDPATSAAKANIARWPATRPPFLSDGVVRGTSVTGGTA
jgi:hypothetical protein